ncbi:hypothetical protein JG687_00006995 [Phytophthora cactorum]|uniref:DUF1279 domain-containing protein n=1 Tax=Phytophthora cactorum TaxID=29920 RepID=A0A8T1UL14_9STRA|nr:hypothetical protein JG687_00006995 [Phytophthora cactorum]
MMLRSGMRYLFVVEGVARRSVGSGSNVQLLVARPHDLPPVLRRAVCSAFHHRLPLLTSQDSKETEPLTGEATSSSSPVQSGEDLEKELEQSTEELQQQSWRQRAKTFAIEYGRVGICTHIVLSMLSFSVIYVGVSSGVDVSAILDSMGLSTSASDSTTNSAGSLLIAYTLYKVLAPIRWPLTFAVTPVVLRALRRRGYMLATTNSSSRSPPPSE